MTTPRENKGPDPYTLYMRKARAAEELKRIENEMVSSTEDGRIVFTTTEKLRELIPALRRAQDEHRRAVQDFLGYLVKEYDEQ